MATCQGWNQCCTLVDCETEEVLGRTETHRGFMYEVAFNHDSDKFAQVDTGHKGVYEVENLKGQFFVLLIVCKIDLLQQP